MYDQDYARIGWFKWEVYHYDPSTHFPAAYPNIIIKRLVVTTLNSAVASCQEKSQSFATGPFKAYLVCLIEGVRGPLPWHLRTLGCPRTTCDRIWSRLGCHICWAKNLPHHNSSVDRFSLGCRTGDIYCCCCLPWVLLCRRKQCSMR